MKTVAFIFARGGSKGLPGKNIRSLDGKPLIGWAIDQARSVSRIERVIVSTDCFEIAGVAKSYGAEVPFMRPKKLAQDTTPEWLAWQHALEYLSTVENYHLDAFVSVPATAPLRLPVDIDKCLDVYSNGDADVVITMTDAHRNPYFNMVKIKEDTTVELVIPPEDAVNRRQDAPSVYDMTTVAYVAKPSFVMNHDSIFQGRVKAVHIPQERSVDIDTAYDFEWAEWLIRKRLVLHE
ncbi:MAG: cytidylyltransferase domain-containing protein [Methylococcaceae bacterium]